MKVATNAICLSYHGVDADGKATRGSIMVETRLPDHLPPRLRAYRDRYEHHLLLKMKNY